MKVLITGSTGQVGFELVRQFDAIATVFAPTRQQLNLADQEAVRHYLQLNQPDIIINPAAWTAVDAAETDREGAELLNAQLPATLASYCAEHHKALLHYSTDYVYPGNGEDLWREDSPTAPTNYYGVTKLAGDNAVQSSGCQHVILRTSWVYAARGKNFMRTMLKLAQQREQLSVVADQWGAPTPARFIASISFLIVQRMLQQKFSSGLYHLAPSGVTNWHQFACKIFQLANKQEAMLKIQREDQVSAIKAIDYPTPATRPDNSRLNLQKIETELGIKLPDWSTLLEHTVQEWLDTQVQGR